MEVALLVRPSPLRARRGSPAVLGGVPQRHQPAARTAWLHLLGNVHSQRIQKITAGAFRGTWGERFLGAPLDVAVICSAIVYVADGGNAVVLWRCGAVALWRCGAVVLQFAPA